MIKQLKSNLNKQKQFSNPIKSICFYSFNEQDALSTLRLIAPARHLEIKVIYGVERGQIYVDRAQPADVIVMQRDFPRALEAYESILSIAHNNHIPLVLDIDDLLFEMPEDHPDRRHHTFAGYLLPTFQALLEVDLVTVTTSRLRDFIHAYNKKVAVLPNYLDDQIWKLKPTPKIIKPDGKIVIGYMGGHSHPPDIAVLVPVIQVLTGLYPQQVEFHFWGAEPPHELSTVRSVHWHDQIIWNYQDFAVYFQSQPIDILVAPLADNKFNNCKSSIKYLEYGSLGVPAVYSKVDPYTAVIEQGVNGFLASTAEDWLDCLTRLINNLELRQTLARNATADIQKNWLLSKNADKWLAAYQKARRSRLGSGADNAHLTRMLHNFSTQLVAWDNDARSQLQMQRQKIVELEDLLAQRDATISGIYNSRTWKLALRLRHISEAIRPRKN